LCWTKDKGTLFRRGKKVKYLSYLDWLSNYLSFILVNKQTNNYFMKSHSTQTILQNCVFDFIKKIGAWLNKKKKDKYIHACELLLTDLWKVNVRKVQETNNFSIELYWCTSLKKLQRVVHVILDPVWSVTWCWWIDSLLCLITPFVLVCSEN